MGEDYQELGGCDRGFRWRLEDHLPEIEEDK